MVYGKCEMMAEYICYGVLYIAEATIAWLYFDALFCRKSSGLKIGITFAVAYLLLFGITWFNSVVLNGAAFFLANLLLLWMNYECKLRSAILHSAFLTSIMAITEIIAAWIISLFGFRFGAYADSLAIMIVMAVISKMLYFSITVIAAKLWAPNRQAQEEPAFMGLLCILPIFSVIVSAVVVYIGVRAEMTKPVELLMIIIVLTLLIVNLIFMVIYNQFEYSKRRSRCCILSGSAKAVRKPAHSHTRYQKTSKYYSRLGKRFQRSGDIRVYYKTRG